MRAHITRACIACMCIVICVWSMFWYLFLRVLSALSVWYVFVRKLCMRINCMHQIPAVCIWRWNWDQSSSKRVILYCTLLNSCFINKVCYFFEYGSLSLPLIKVIILSEIVRIEQIKGSAAFILDRTKLQPLPPPACSERKGPGHRAGYACLELIHAWAARPGTRTGLSLLAWWMLNSNIMGTRLTYMK